MINMHRRTLLSLAAASTALAVLPEVAAAEQPFTFKMGLQVPYAEFFHNDSGPDYPVYRYSFVTTVEVLKDTWTYNIALRGGSNASFSNPGPMSGIELLTRLFAWFETLGPQHFILNLDNSWDFETMVLGGTIERYGWVHGGDAALDSLIDRRLVAGRALRAHSMGYDYLATPC